MQISIGLSLARPSQTLAATFNPLYLLDCELWLDGADASTITQSSGMVSQWNDKSGNHYNATQGTGANQPAYLSNGIIGKGSVSSGSAGQMSMSTSILSGASGATAFFVSQNSSETGNQGAPLENFGSSGINSHMPYSGEIYSDFGNAGRYGPIGYTTGALLVPQIYTITAGSTWTMLQGLTLLYSTSSTFTPPSGEIGPPSLFSSSAGGTYQWLGTLAELIIYRRVLTSTEQTEVYNYLKAKWGTP